MLFSVDNTCTRAAYVGYPGSFEASMLFSVDNTWLCSLLRSPHSASSGFDGSIGSPVRWNMDTPFTGTRSSKCIIWLLCALACLEAVIFPDLFLSFFLGTPSRPFLNPCPSVSRLSIVQPPAIVEPVLRRHLQNPSSGCYVLWLVWRQLSSSISSSPFSWAHLPDPSLTPTLVLPG